MVNANGAADFVYSLALLDKTPTMALILNTAADMGISGSVLTERLVVGRVKVTPIVIQAYEDLSVASARSTIWKEQPGSDSELARTAASFHRKLEIMLREMLR